MQETAQITTALRYLPWGKHVALITDGRFSGFSSGACVGHIGPEALHGGPIGRVRDDDLIEIVIDRNTLTGSVNLVGVAGQALDALACTALLEQRGPHPGLAPHAALPADTRLWAALQRASGGTWAGCVYDVDRIVATIEAGLELTKGGDVIQVQRWMSVVGGIMACAPQPAFAQASGGVQGDPSIVAPGARLERLFGDGFFTEGPAQAPDGSVYFSDITFVKASGNQAGHIWRWDPRTGTTVVFRSPSGMANGIAFDAAGRMVVAEGAGFGGRRLTRTDMQT